MEGSSGNSHASGVLNEREGIELDGIPHCDRHFSAPCMSLFVRAEEIVVPDQVCGACPGSATNLANRFENGKVILAKARTKEAIRPRARILDAAYDLFAKNGVSQVGIEAILAESDCAKASLYSNFDSKVDLAIAFLDRRETVWTRGWLETEIKRRSSKPEERLLAIFDVFDGWFRKQDFEGCSFINVLLESNIESPVRRAAAKHLSKIRAIIRDLAKEANLREPEKFAQAWHMLMKGSIVSASEGNRNAAREAKRAALLIIDGWARNRDR